MSARMAEGVANSTVNRTMEVIRAVLRRAAYDWDWIGKAPRVRMLPEPKRRIRWLTREEADRLVAALPAHLAAMARFSLETGLRRSNVTGLQWSQVDLLRRLAWIHPDQAKARKAIAVPLNAVAVALCGESRSGSIATHVFSFRGMPMRQVNTKAWTQALRRAGIEDFRWHDLRHTWASWHVQSGHAAACAAGAGWLGECRRWCGGTRIFSAEHLAPYADRMCALWVGEAEQSLARSGHSPEMKRACIHASP